MTAVMLRFDELQSTFGELMPEQFARSYCVTEEVPPVEPVEKLIAIHRGRTGARIR
jgi:hypothetical protein